VSTSPTGDPFGPVYRLMDEIWGAHLEMAELMQGYKALVEEPEGVLTACAATTRDRSMPIRLRSIDDAPQ